MSSKDQTHHKDKPSSKRRALKPATESSDGIAQQQTHPGAIIEKADLEPGSLNAGEVLQLQRTVGNQAGQRLLLQRQGLEEEALRQGESETAQRAEGEEELSQGKPEAEHLEQEPDSQSNRTGLPDDLKAGTETLSGVSMDHVKVHYDSAQSAQVDALAYTQGADSHVAPGQAQHLPHVVQKGNAQKQESPGKEEAVKPVLQLQKEEEGVVQRKVFIGSALLKLHSVRKEEKEAGEGDRNVETMITDRKNRKFKDKNEMILYANHQTNDIGYVEREKTWVRLEPDRLVLGEKHSATTLPDIVDATEIKNFKYEGEKGEHAAERRFPKKAIGLIGIKRGISEPLKYYRSIINIGQSRLETINKDIKQEREKQLKAKPAKSPDKKGEFEQWERKMEAAYTREGTYFRGYGESRQLHEQAPGKDYSREATEIRLALEALNELKASKAMEWVKYYKKHKGTVEKTIKELENGVSLYNTTMFVEMLKGKFDLDTLIDLYKAAAVEEFSETKTAVVEGIEGYSYARAETPPEGESIEKLRDSYMLDAVRKEPAGALFVLGIGEQHRQNLKIILDNESIKNFSVDDFIKEQRKEHGG